MTPLMKYGKITRMKANASESASATGQSFRRYPVFSLGTAIKKIQALYKASKRNPVALGLALEQWGYKSHKSSSATRCASSLVAYGLIEVIGGKGDRRIRISDLGFNLAENPLTQSENYLAWLREAAFNPKVFREVWERYKEHGLPEDERVLEFDLRKDFGLSDSAVSPFLSAFKETMALAKAGESGVLSERSGDPANRDSVGNQNTDKTRTDHGFSTIFAPPKPPKLLDPPKLKDGDTGGEMELTSYCLSGGLRLSLRGTPPFPSSVLAGVLVDLEKALKAESFRSRLAPEKPAQESVAIPTGRAFTFSKPTESKPVVSGTLIQWESEGAYQFKHPRRVERLQDGFVFVEGTSTGIPISQVLVASSSGSNES